MFCAEGWGQSVQSQYAVGLYTKLLLEQRNEEQV